jgi:hypothetical protein
VTKNRPHRFPVVPAPWVERRRYKPKGAIAAQQHIIAGRFSMDVE